MRIGLIQMRCEKGAIAENLAAIESHLAAATRQQVDLLCFPEMSITGYDDPTRHPEAALRLDGPEVARFVAMTRATPVTALAGLIEANPAGKPFITQVAARNGALIAIYRKRTIEDEEAAWFAPGSTIVTFPLSETIAGMAICADISNPAVFAENARQGARIIFEAAAPGLYGAQETRDWQSGYEWWRGECFTKLGGYARKHSVYIAVATQAGRTRDEDFPGGGYVFGPDGACLCETENWSECALYVDLPIT